MTDTSGALTPEQIAELKKRREARGTAPSEPSPQFQYERNLALETDAPDDAAYDLKKSTELGIPREAIAGAREEYRAEDMLRQMEVMRKEAPRTTAWMQRPDNYAVARDDVATLSATEKHFDPWLSDGGVRLMDISKTWNEFFGNIGGAARAAIPGWKAQGAGLVQQQAESLGAYDAELKAYEESRKGSIQIEVGDFTLRFNPAWFGVGDPKPEAPLIAKMLNLEEPGGLAIREPGPDKFRAEARKRYDAVLKPVAAEAARIGREASEEQKALMPKTGDFVADSLLSGVTAFVNMAPSMVGFIVAGPTTGAGIMGGQVYGQTYSEGRTQYNLEPTAANERAVGHALVETISERISLGVIDEIIKSNAPIWKKMLAGMGAEQVQEQGATLGGDVVDWATVAQDKTLSEFLAERPARMAQTALATLVASGGMQGTFLAIDYGTRAFMKDAVAAQKSQGDKLIDGLLNDAARSKLRTRAPEKAAELATKLTEGTNAETVVIDLDGLAQSLEAAGLDVMATMTEMGIPAEAINETAIVMGQVEVPTARLMVSEGIQTHRDKVQPHLRLASEDLTPAQKEAIGAEASNQAAKFSEAIREDVARDADFASQIAEVEEAVTTQLREAGFSGQTSVLRANAVLASRMAAYVAKRRGQDVRDVWKEIGPTIVGQFGGVGETAAPDVLRQAEEAGYAGRDRGEAESWVRAVEKGLDMSTPARMARAKEMGFDTETVLYRGAANFNGTELDGAVFTSTDPEVGAAYAFRKARRRYREEGPTAEEQATLDGLAAEREQFERAQKNPFIGKDRRRELRDKKWEKKWEGDAAEREFTTLRGGQIMPLYGRAKNPMTVDGSKLDPTGDMDSGDVMRRLIADARAKGHDGVIVKGWHDSWSDKVTDFHIFLDPSNIRSVHAAFDPDQSGSSDLLAQSIRQAARMDMAEVKQWVINNVTSTESDFPNGDVLTVVKFPLTEDPDAPEVMLSIRLADKNGRADVNLFLDNQMADSLEGVEDVAQRGTLAKIMFAKTVMVMRQYAAEYDVKAFNFIAAESQAEGTKAKSREALYRFMLSTLNMDGYTAYELDSQMSVVREQDGAKVADPLFPGSGFVLVKDGVNVEEYARNEIIRGRQRGGDAGEVVTVLTAKRLGRANPGDRGGRGRGGVGTSDAGGFAGDELAQTAILNDPEVQQALNDPETDVLPLTEDMQILDLDQFIAFHGTLAKFDEFKTDKIGAGEGAQAFGPGHYFTQSRGIADWYRKRMKQLAPGIRMGKETFNKANPAHFALAEYWKYRDKLLHYDLFGGYKSLASDLSHSGALERAKFSLQYEIDQLEYPLSYPGGRGVSEYAEVDRPVIRDRQELIAFLKAGLAHLETLDPDSSKGIPKPRKPVLRGGGNIYTVAVKLPAEQTIQYDKPFGQQSPAVQKAFREAAEAGHLGKAGAALEKYGDATRMDVLVAALKNMKSPAMDVMRANGIRGVRYLDGMSRGKKNKAGQSYNYVVFNDSDVQVLDREGHLFQSLDQERRGGYSPSTRRITFTEARDVSTFMHETAHWFLDTLEKLAPTEAWAAADLAEIDAWYQTVRDTPKMAAIRARYTIAQTAGGWQVLYQGQPLGPAYASPQEAEARIEWRERQEAFAETFEQYLMTGKAPTPKLADVFRAFRDWLVNLYRGMMPGDRAALNPAIRDVFDRVLAVDTEVDAASAEAFRDADTMAKDMLAKGVITERQYRMVGERLNKAREEVKEEMIARALKEEMRTREDWWAKEKARVKGDLARAFDKSEVGRAFNWLAYGEWKGDTELQAEPASEFADEEYGALFQSMRDTIRPAADQQIETAPTAPTRQAMLSDLNTLTRMAEVLLPDARNEELANATLRLRQTIEQEDATPNDEFRGRYVSGLMMLSDALQNVEGGQPLAAAVADNLEAGTGAAVRSMLEYRGIRIMTSENVGEAPMVLSRGAMFASDVLFQSRTFNPPGHGPVTPPPNVPPVRLDLKIVRDLYGEEAVRKLPAAVRRRSSTSSNVTDMLAMIDTLRKTLAKRRKGPQTLTQFIMRRKATMADGTKEDRAWGIKGAAAELKAMGLEKLINEKSGRTLDYVREAAEEAGFIRPRAIDADISTQPGDLDTTQNDLLDALAKEAKGEAVVRFEDEGANKELTDARTWASWLEQNGVNIYETDKKALKAQVEAMLSNTDESLVSPDQAAELFGFRNGEELLAALAQVGNRDKFLDEQADRALANEFGDMMNDGTLIEEAREAARLSILGRQSEIELEALSRAVGQQASTNYARQMARDIIALRTVKEIAAYERDLDNERRFSKQALTAVSKGDYATALKAKQRQIIAAQMYREGKKAHERIEKQRKDLLKYLTSESRRDKIANDYLERIDAVLDDFELRVSKQGPGVQKARQSAAVYVAWMTEQGREAEIAPEAMLLATQASLKTWRNLTAEEVDYLVGTIENLAHLGRTKQRLLNDKEKREREAILDELEATLLAAPSAKTSRDKSFTPTVGEGVAMWLRKAHARLTRMEFQFARLDGREGGPLHSALFQPFADAADRETARMRDAAVRMQELYAIFTPAERNALFHRRIATPELKAPGKGLTLMDAVVIGLNWGNAGNRQALIDGYGWDGAAIEAMLNRVLTDKHWTFIEGVWDLIGSYRADAFALEKSITGVAPKAVEGISFTLANGRKIEGKYYPLKYDSGQPRADSVKQARLDEKQMLNEMGKSFSKPMTKTGHLIERVGSGGKPVKLSIGVFHEHVASVIHDIAYRRSIIDVYKLVTSPRFANAYIQAAGREQYDMLVPWIAQIANERKDEPGGYVTDLLRGARRNFSVMAMGLKVGTAVQQATGVLQAVPLIGSRYSAQGFFKAIGGGPASFWSAWNWVSQKSEFMRDRPMGFDRDVREVTNKLQERTPLGFVRRNAFILIGVMDTAVSTGVWIGAYDKALDGNVPGLAKGDEESAIAFADSIVRRSQVAGRMQDLPQMMRGTELEKLMTVVYSYFSGLYNETASEVLRVRGGQLNPLAFSANMTLLYVVIPLVASALAGRLFADDDDDELDEKVAKELASNAVSTIPFARDVINATINPQFGYQLSPAGSIIEGGTKAAANIATGEGFETEYATKQTFNLLGLLFGLPTGQLWITGEYAYDVATGQEAPAEDPADAISEALLRDTR